jgi:alkylation response protein AidB-like acyl-CoA dehydrogenase
VTLLFTADHEALRDSVRSFLASRSPEAEVRRLMAEPAGFDRDAWHTMAKELGLQGLAIAEKYGGSGFTMVELAVVLEETGRTLLCAPFLATAVLAGTLLTHCGDGDAQRRYLPGIASGEIVATVAVSEDSGRWDAAGISLAAAPSGGRWTLTGTKSYVLDGLDADVVFAVARTPRGIGVFAVEADAPGLTGQALPVLDQTRRQARLGFDRVPATPVGDVGDPVAGWDLVRIVLDHAAAALAMEQVGGAERVLEQAVDHAKTRFQFGRPIGSFQAVKHKCADMLILVEQSRAVAHHAIEASGGPQREFALAASLAKAFCSSAYTRVAGENIQVHGGMGFTWEHSAHLYLKRAKSSEALLGDPLYHRGLIGDVLDA